MKYFLFQTEGFSLESYPFFMGLAWGLSYLLANRSFNKAEISFNLLPTYLGLFISSFLGAKIFFLITNPDHLIHYGSLNFWAGGGFVFYGGAILGAIFLYFWSIKLKRFPIERLYLLVATLPFAHAVGRIGCLMAGCCYGSSCDLPWSVYLHGIERHPVQLYEAFALSAIGFFIQFKMSESKWKNAQIIPFYLASYSVARFFLEFFRGDEVRGIVYGLSTSQWISTCVFILTIIYYKLLLNSRR